jgi:hypothetical protein
MFWLFRKGKFGLLSMVISLAITLLVLFWLWAAIAPASLFYQIVFAVVLLVFGVVLFVSLVFFFAMASMLIFFLLLRRKIKKSTRKLFERLER